MLQYNVVVRNMTEWTVGSQNCSIDRASITDGIGGIIPVSTLAATPTTISATAISVSGSSVTFTVASGGTAYGPGSYVTVTAGNANTTSGTINGSYQVTASTGTSIVVQNNTGVAISGTTTATLSPSGTITTLANVRQALIQGIEGTNGTGSTGNGFGYVPASGAPIPSGCPAVVSGQVATVRRYQVNLAFGLLTQDKLLPTKYMASQVAIEMTLENPQACIFMPFPTTGIQTPPTYYVANLNLIPEIIEFDDTYDEQFLAGLQSGGVPIKFATWNYYQFSTQASSNLQLQINERSRSVKGIYVVQRRAPAAFQYDSHACFFDTTAAYSQSGASTMQSYQYRIGGRYFPGSPVQTSSPGVPYCNGGAEAYVELEKFLNIVGRYDITSNIIPQNWAVPSLQTNYNGGSTTGFFPEYDYAYVIAGFSPSGIPNYIACENSSFGAGMTPSCMFAAAINFETSNGIEISGLNAEEQSDISCNIIWSSAQTQGFIIEAYTYVDRMIVLRPNNYLDLIQ